MVKVGIVSYFLSWETSILSPLSMVLIVHNPFDDWPLLGAGLGGGRNTHLLSLLSKGSLLMESYLLYCSEKNPLIRKYQFHGSTNDTVKMSAEGNPRYLLSSYYVAGTLLPHFLQQ